MRPCPVCQRPYLPGSGYALLCRLCCRSLRRAESRSGDVYTVIVWAAQRARYFARLLVAVAVLAGCAVPVDDAPPPRAPVTVLLVVPADLPPAWALAVTTARQRLNGYVGREAVVLEGPARRTVTVVAAPTGTVARALLTQLEPDAQGYYTAHTIYLALDNLDAGDVHVGPEGSAGWMQSAVEVAMHEMGHALGMEHTAGGVMSGDWDDSWTDYDRAECWRAKVCL